jgi:hypothetical protein
VLLSSQTRRQALTVRLCLEMVSRHPNIWKSLPFIALGLMLVRDFTPVSDLLDKSLSWVSIAILLAFSGSYFWQERRERQADQSSSAAISPGDGT